VEFDGGIGFAGGRGPGLRRFSHEAMNTVFEVHVAGADARYAAEAAQAAFALVDRLEGELSRFRHNSDITRINHLAAGERTRVGEAAFECLVIARHIHDLTAGAFDIAIGTGLPALELDAESYEVHATADGVRVDLGGIGKGYAVDLVAELLEEWGLERAFVHGGFSSAIALEPPEAADGWPLTLSDPRQPAQVFHRLSLRQTALGASGVRKGDHIRDPRTGQPVRGRLAAWAALPRPQKPAGAAGDPAAAGPRLAPGAVADALTTAFMLLPVEEIEALCRRSPGLEAWILADGGSGSGDVLHLPGPAPEAAGGDSA
jgi:thiamine biosynthesis lipoprotein